MFIFVNTPFLNFFVTIQNFSKYFVLTSNSELLIREKMTLLENILKSAPKLALITKRGQIFDDLTLTRV